MVSALGSTRACKIDWQSERRPMVTSHLDDRERSLALAVSTREVIRNTLLSECNNILGGGGGRDRKHGIRTEK